MKSNKSSASLQGGHTGGGTDELKVGVDVIRL
jgi:hypothetical protein